VVVDAIKPSLLAMFNQLDVSANVYAWLAQKGKGQVAGELHMSNTERSKAG